MDDFDSVGLIGQPDLKLLEHGTRSIHGYNSPARNQIEQKLRISARATAGVEHSLHPSEIQA